MESLEKTLKNLREIEQKRKKKNVKNLINEAGKQFFFIKICCKDEKN